MGILARGCYTIIDEKNESIEKIFYHYTNINALMNIVTSGKFWNTNIHYLNDKKEFDHYFDLVDEIMSCPEYRDKDEDKYYQAHKSSRNERKIKFFISSFTTHYEIDLDKNIIQEIVMGPSADSQYLEESLSFFLRHHRLTQVILTPTNSSLRR